MWGEMGECDWEGSVSDISFCSMFLGSEMLKASEDRWARGVHEQSAAVRNKVGNALSVYSSIILSI